MKVKVTYRWIAELLALRNYMNLVDKDTNAPIVQLGKNAAWAVGRTVKLIKPDIELLEDKEKEKAEKVKELNIKISDLDRDSKEKPEKLPDLEAAKKELVSFQERWQEEWKEILEKEVELEIHGLRASELPANPKLPQSFFEALMEMDMESKEEKK